MYIFNEKSAYIVPLPSKVCVCVCVWGGGGLFLKKRFSFLGQKFLGKLMIKSGWGRGAGGGGGNVFSSNLNTVNLKIFPNHVGIYTYILDDTAKP